MLVRRKTRGIKMRSVNLNSIRLHDAKGLHAFCNLYLQRKSSIGPKLLFSRGCLGCTFSLLFASRKKRTKFNTKFDAPHYSDKVASLASNFATFRCLPNISVNISSKNPSYLIFKAIHHYVK